VPLEPPVRRGLWSREWPILLVLAVVLVSMVVVVSGQFRSGCILLAGAVVLAFFLRLLLPGREAGMLAVRSRLVDLLVLGVLSGAVSALALLVPVAI
jgi:hypothetical protein